MNRNNSVIFEWKCLIDQQANSIPYTQYQQLRIKNALPNLVANSREKATPQKTQHMKSKNRLLGVSINLTYRVDFMINNLFIGFGSFNRAFEICKLF